MNERPKMGRPKRAISDTELHALYAAQQHFGSMSELARQLHISRQALHKWSRHGIPLMHVARLEQLTGIPRWELRPSVYTSKGNPPKERRMSEFAIEKNVPFPKKVPKAESKYPFREMQVGDSFLVPLEKAKAVRIAASIYRKKNFGWNFKARTLPEGARVWRVE